MRLRFSGLALALALATPAIVGAQQTGITVNGDDVTINGCVTRPATQMLGSPSMLVWSRGDIMIAAAAAATPAAPNPVGTTGLAGRVFYWIDDDEDELKEHVGQLVEVKGELEDFEEGEVEIRRDGSFTEIELDLGGEEEKLRVPSSWLGTAGSEKDQEFDIIGRRIDIDDVRVIGAC